MACAAIAGEPAALSEALGDALEDPGRLMFLPYLSGERTPHNDADMRGVFAGLQADTDRLAMTAQCWRGSPSPYAIVWRRPVTIHGPNA